MIGSGDIARCGSEGDEQTAAIVDSVLRADTLAKVDNAVFTIGDNAYDAGTPAQFANCFGASWGDTSKLIMKYIRPSPGNHEFYTARGRPYYDYFGDRAGPDQRGYYSYDIGDWHVVSLNSQLTLYRISFEDAAEQDDWLEKDLAANTRRCTLAYFHHPLYSSGNHGSSPQVRRLWQILYKHNADLILAGHDHHYERFLPQTPAGIIDTARGIPEILVGTGGGDLRDVSNPPAPNSAVQIRGYFGVVKLTLGPSGYSHAFIDTSRRIWDSGAGTCH